MGEQADKTRVQEDMKAAPAPAILPQPGDNAGREETHGVLGRGKRREEVEDMRISE